MSLNLAVDLVPLTPGPPPEHPLSWNQARKTPRTEYLRTMPLAIYTQPFHVAGGFFFKTLMVNNPEGAKRVLLDNVANYPKTDLEKRFFSMIFGNGLLSSDGEVWRTHRRTMAPAFDPRSVASYAPSMAATAQAFAQRWRNLPDGHVIDVAEDMLKVTLQIIAGTMFSTDTDEIIDEVATTLHSAGLIRPSLAEFLPVVGEYFLREHEKKIAKSFARLDGLVERFISEREAQMQAGGAPNDLLGRLIAAKDAETGVAMTPREVRDQMLTIFLAGHETTATALTWAWYVLAERPAEAAKLHAELDAVLQGRPPTFDDVPRLPYARAVIDEVLRLYPAAPMLSARQAVADDVVAGRKIKAGDLISVSPWVLNRHRDLWDDPEAFNPDRFLSGNTERPRFAYIPFGAGPRICIGMQLALTEAVMLLATLAQAFRLERADSQPVRLRHQITLRPEGGLNMRVFRRTSV